MARLDIGSQARLDRAQAVRSGGMSSVALPFVTHSLSARTLTTQPLVKAFVLSAILNSPVEGYIQTCLALATASDPDYGETRAETMIIAGEEDLISPKETMDMLMGKIRGARVHTCSGAGHWVMLEAQEEVAEVLRGLV